MKTRSKRAIVFITLALVYILVASIILTPNNISNAKGFTLHIQNRCDEAIDQATKLQLDYPMVSHTYADIQVNPDDDCYLAVERLAAYRGGDDGFPCGGLLEPCDGDHRPYFRPEMPLFH